MAKKKIMKALKKAAPFLAVAGLGKAFMNARNRRNQMKDFLTTNGFRQIKTGPEGSVTLENKIIPNEPFFRDQYKGIPCVQELLATKM